MKAWLSACIATRAINPTAVRKTTIQTSTEVDLLMGNPCYLAARLFMGSGAYLLDTAQAHLVAIELENRGKTRYRRDRSDTA